MYIQRFFIFFGFVAFLGIAFDALFENTFASQKIQVHHERNEQRRCPVCHEQGDLTGNGFVLCSDGHAAVHVDCVNDSAFDGECPVLGCGRALPRLNSAVSAEIKNIGEKKTGYKKKAQDLYVAFSELVAFVQNPDTSFHEIENARKDLLDKLNSTCALGSTWLSPGILYGNLVFRYGVLALAANLGSALMPMVSPEQVWFLCVFVPTSVFLVKRKVNKIKNGSISNLGWQDDKKYWAANQADETLKEFLTLVHSKKHVFAEHIPDGPLAIYLWLEKLAEHPVRICKKYLKDESKKF